MALPPAFDWNTVRQSRGTLIDEARPNACTHMNGRYTMKRMHALCLAVCLGATAPLAMAATNMNDNDAPSTQTGGATGVGPGTMNSDGTGTGTMQRDGTGSGTMNGSGTGGSGMGGSTTDSDDNQGGTGGSGMGGSGSGTGSGSSGSGGAGGAGGGGGGGGG